MTQSCEELHQWANALPKHSFPFKESEIPQNGIYMLFQTGEKAHVSDRIVRIGTHTGEGQLRSRLKEHFLVPNKDRSIFRKNIGRAILNKSNDPFFAVWERDMTTKVARKAPFTNGETVYQAGLEEKVSDFIRSNFWFVVQSVETKEARLRRETELISSVSLCSACGASEGWLGSFSPKEKIRRSGLWQEMGVFKTRVQ